MAYSKEQKENILNSIFKDIENGLSTRKAILNNSISFETFFKWIDENEDKAKQYARAKELGIEAKFDSISEDYNETPQLNSFGSVDSAWVQMQRLKIDAKKWELSKLAPKKYGDKLEVEQNGNMTISWNEEKTYEK